MIEPEELLELLQRVCEAFNADDGIGFVSVLTPDGFTMGQLMEDAAEVLMELNQLREDLEEELG